MAKHDLVSRGAIALPDLQASTGLFWQLLADAQCRWCHMLHKSVGRKLGKRGKALPQRDRDISQRWGARLLPKEAESGKPTAQILAVMLSGF